MKRKFDWSFIMIYIIPVILFIGVMIFIACSITSCTDKPKLEVPKYVCYECTLNKIKKDSCGAFQDINSWVISMQHKGYTCLTKESK